MKQLLPLNHFKAKSLTIAIATALASQSALAETSASDEEMPELDMVIVVGQATGGLDTFIGEEELEKIQADDLADVFRRDASVAVGGSVQMSQKIYVRNTGEDRLHISVDGAEIAAGIFHHSGRVSMEPELIKQVEVEAGAGSATAGPGALGGSVRFVTKDPEDMLEPGQSFGALVKGGYFSNSSGKKLSATAFGGDKQGVISAMASITHSDHDNSEDGNGDELIGTNLKTEMAFVKAVADLGDHYVSLSHERLEEDGDVLYKPEFIPAGNNPVSPTEGVRDTTILNYGINPVSDLVDFSVNLYNTDQEQARNWGSTAFFYDGGIKSMGLTLQNISQVGSHKLIYGINYRDDEGWLNDMDISPYRFEEEGSVKGVYLQDVMSFDQLTVTAGARFDKYELTDRQGMNISDSGVSPNLSANYQISSNLAVSAGYAEALNGAEVNDAFALSTYTNSSDLEAETVQNLELGLDFNQGDFGGSIGVYRSVIENAFGATTPWSKNVINLEDDVETDGFTANAEYQAGALLVSGGLNIADSKIGDEIATRYVYSSSAISIGDTATLDVNYQFSDSFAAGWGAEFVKGIHDINLNVGGDNLTVDKPGYAVHDIYAHWLPTGSEDLAINFTVKNLFNKHYLSHASVEDFSHNAGYEVISGNAEAGRDVRVSVALKF